MAATETERLILRPWQESDVAELLRLFGDPAVRFAVNLIGQPALGPKEFFARKPETTLGASIVVSIPAGQYDSAKLINLGTNRWAFKPELGLSYPRGPWDLEL